MINEGWDQNVEVCNPWKNAIVTDRAALVFDDSSTLLKILSHVCQLFYCRNHNRHIANIVFAKLPDFLSGIKRILLESGISTLLKFLHEKLTERDTKKQTLHCLLLKFPFLAISTVYPVPTFMETSPESDGRKQIFIQKKSWEDRRKLLKITIIIRRETRLELVMFEAETDGIDGGTAQYYDMYINIWFARVLCFVRIVLNRWVINQVCYFDLDKDHRDDCSQVTV